MESLNTNNWLVFEDDNGRAAEYADFDEQVEMAPGDAAEHHEYVCRLGQEYGFPIPDWKPIIPLRDRS